MRHFLKTSCASLAVMALAATAALAAPPIATTPDTAMPANSPGPNTVKPNSSVDSAAIDAHTLQGGLRASKIRGSEVVNDQNQKIGTVDDLIVTPEGHVPVAILSVGGFLGVGSHLVAVPIDKLQMQQDKLTLPGATKDQLKAMPEFKYST